MPKQFTSWAVTFVAVTLFLGMAATAVSIVADSAGWGSVHLGIGPVLILEITSSGTESSFALGPGVLLVGAALATVNSLVSGVLITRSERSHA